ncbi:MAG: putative sulfate/molybdate transporter [Phycisphaerae bacterium]
MRFDRVEAGGALGDLGTYIPLLVGMVSQCGLQLAPTLVFTGLMNVVTGLVFRIPMPVQPMKAIAAVAIAEGLSESEILTAGLITGAVILFLGVTGLIDRLNRAIPRSVVRGLQLALGLKLLTGGFEMIAGTGTLWGWDSVALGMLCAALVLGLYFSQRIPGALVVFAVGLVALLAAEPGLLSATRLGADWNWPRLGHLADWQSGLWRAAVPQIPLTTLNSVIAVCALSTDLFPRNPASPRRVALSVGLMNLIGCPLGSMPACHGAGGLAAQHRFGARTGGSIVMLGGAKIVLGITLGGSLLLWLGHYPKSVLGVLLLFSGLELALICRDQRTRVDYFVLLITAGACIALNTAVGFAVGWAMAALLLWGVFRIEPKPEDDTASD